MKKDVFCQYCIDSYRPVENIMGFDFREHFTNHKMQLFTYLKMLGLPVNTNTLYAI